MTVLVLNAEDLPPTSDSHGHCDPYCVLYIDSPPKKYRTAVRKRTLTPVWNDLTVLPVTGCVR